MSDYKVVHMRYDKYVELKEIADSIVHCIDCKHAHPLAEKEQLISCDYDCVAWNYDDFCSRGEHK